MPNSRILIANERLKAISSALFQLGTALLAAGIVKIYVDGALSLEAAGWILTAIMLMFVALKVLSLMEAEH